MEKNSIPTTETIFELFKQLNKVPRPSWHEERVADWLCAFAVNNGLECQRDEHNCIVMRKPASAGHENAEPIVLHAHMDMVCVATPDKPFNPLTDPIEAYVEEGWMKAHGTSLGADNGMGLCMALAVMQHKELTHGPLELFVTTNEEDGMTGAANVSPDFVRARKMIDLDSEDYDTITVGAAGAYLQTARLPFEAQEAPSLQYFKVSISGGLGGHSGVDIGKGRMSAVKQICLLIDALRSACKSLEVADIHAGEANASIAANAVVTVGVNPSEIEILKQVAGSFNPRTPNDAQVSVTSAETEKPATIIPATTIGELTKCIAAIPFGVVKMSEHMPGTVETSNNIGVIRTEADHLHISTHTRSFIDADMIALGESIGKTFRSHGTTTQLIMSTPAWEENPHSDYMHLVEQTFEDVLGFTPRKVEMHFVMEMGYFVQKFPGIQIIPIGPRIIEPHSTSERIELSTIEGIWKVLVELLCRLA